MSDTKIEWTDATWNVLAGCQKVSPGCDHCYAIPNSHRLAGNDNLKIAAPYIGTTQRTDAGIDWTGNVTLRPERLELPLRWYSPRRIFVNSMSDLFHEDVPEHFIMSVLEVMTKASWHTYQVLTKRPDKMLRVMSHFVSMNNAVLPNLWLGVSVESQDYAWRIDKLLRTPAAVRFVSAEPLLGPLNLSRFLPDTRINQPYTALDWVIVGGESDRGARECKPQWISDIVDQCHWCDVPVFVKQLGSVYARECGFSDSKAGDPFEWSAHLRVREYPR